MKITVKSGTYAVCKLKSTCLPPAEGFLSVTVTGEEVSLVCRQESIPENAAEVQRDFALMKVEGPLDFSLIGILAGISGVLAEEKISIFCISTYDTDYLLVRQKDAARGIQTLRRHGYEVAGTGIDG